MRCPKCHYLSFDPEPRCKNCGYDLDVEVEDADELVLHSAPVTSAPPHDLPLRALESATTPARHVTLELVRPSVDTDAQADPDVEPAPVPVPRYETEAVHEPALAFVGVPDEPAAPKRTAPKPAPVTTELPLFVKTMGPQELGAFGGLAVDDEPEPAIQLPPASRPLSVRRPAAEQARQAPPPQRRPGPMDHDLLEDLRRLEREEHIRSPRTTGRTQAVEPSSDWTPDDGDVHASHRMGAAALDGLLLGGIGAFVLWATLKVAGAPPSALGVRTLLPMGVFLAGVAVTYLLMFTAAGGQTVGKMLMGIRVVGEDDASRVTIGQATGRAILACVSVVTLGLGWTPALLGRGPALHDRLSHTRVVRA